MFLFGPPNVEKLKAKKDIDGLVKTLQYQKDQGQIRRAAAEALGEIGDARAIEPLIAILKDGNSDIHKAGAEALGKIGDARAVKPLIAALKSNNGEVRQAAAEALGKIGDACAIDSLVDALSSEDVCLAATDVLVKIGTPAVGPLTNTLRDNNLYLRKAAVKVLDEIGWKPGLDETGASYWVVKREWERCIEIGAPAVDSLIAVLKGNEGEVRLAAIETLGKIGDARAVVSLIVALKDDSGDLRQASTEALGKIGDARAVEPLISHLVYGGDAVSEALGKIGAPAIEPLIATLKNKDKETSGRRQAAIDALGKIGAPAVEPLIATLRDSNENVRDAATKALGKISDTRAIDPLLTALKNSNREIRAIVLKALDKLGWKPGQDQAGASYWVAKRNWEKCVAVGAPAVDPLVSVLKDSDRDVRQAAVEALGKIGDIRAVAPLVIMLKDSDWSVRQATTEAMDKLGWKPEQDQVGACYWVARGNWIQSVAIGAPAVEPLITALKGNNEDLRQAAAEALGKIGTPAVDSLVSLLKDSDWHIRQASAESLGKIGDARAVEPLIVTLNDNYGVVGKAAVDALGKIGAPAVEPLITALKDSDWNVRQAAAQALERIGTPSVKPLVSVLEDSDWNARQIIAEALDKLDWKPGKDQAGANYWVTKGNWEKCVAVGAPAVDPLVSVLKYSDKDVRQAAVEALGRIGDIRAVDPLVTMLKDSDWHVRQAAAEALGKIGDVRAVEPLITVLNVNEGDVRQAAVKALVKIGTPVIEPLIAYYAENETTLDVLEKIGAPAVVPLIAVLKDGYCDMRQAAAKALGNIRDTRAVEPLIVALKDESDRYVSLAAAEALGKIGDARAVQSLIAKLAELGFSIGGQSHWEKSARKTLVTALGQTGDLRALSALETSLRNDESPGVRDRARRSIEWIRRKKSK